MAPSSNPERTSPSQGGNRGSNPLGARCTIALDGMGGDKAPEEIIRGALRAASLNVDIVLTGDSNHLEHQIKQIAINQDASHIRILHAPQVVAMDDDPMEIFREKRNSSVVAAVKLVYEQKANAAISAGNSGAFYAAAVRYLRFPAITRPCFAVLFPTLRGKTLLLDVGANADCLPFHLLDFALLGEAFMRQVEGIPEPRITLLNIGEEPGKGNNLMKKAFRILRNAPINFVGNIQGRDLLSGIADVVVTDGFTGNVVLKSVEGVGKTLRRILMKQGSQGIMGRIAFLLLLPTLRKSMSSLDYQEYGGAPILGIRGICVVAHGSATSRAIYSCIRQTKRMLEADFIRKMEEHIIFKKKRRRESVFGRDFGDRGLSSGEGPQ